VRRGARHLYVHLPFCASRCGYCDFVTVVGHADLHGAYVDALPHEAAATICSFECTFCTACAAELKDVCPNCGGELVARPRRQP